MFFSNRSRLPPELNDMVIDHLQNDKAALSSTALVDKSWLIRSRIHLFRAISVTGDFAAFARFLQEKAHLRKHVRKLVLGGQSPYFGAADPAQLEPAVLARVLSQLPHLSHLCLQDVSFHSNVPYIHPRLFQLEDLTLINVGSCEDTTNDLLRVLGLFSDVHSLNILAVGQYLDDNDAQARTDGLQLPRSLKVTSLKIEDAPCELYMQIFRQTESVHTIKTIEMECGYFGDLEALTELLQHTSSNVESLSVNLTQCFAAGGDETEPLPMLSSDAVCETLGLGLSACTQLKSLEICVSLDNPGGNEAWKTVSGLLRSAPASSIRRLDVGLASEDYVEPLLELGLDWEPLSTALTRFSGVEGVRIGQVPETSWVISQREQEVVRSGLPDLVKRGVLRTA